MILATPNRPHAAGASACKGRGVPVLIEKPVADSLDQARRMVAAVERSNVAALVGHHRRYSAVMAAARQVIGAGELGRLVAVQSSALFHKPASYYAEAPWRHRAGGGPILLNLVHEIDNLRLLGGEIDAVQALASNARRGHEVEDTVAVSLHFANGALGTFLLSDVAASTRSWEQTSGENPASTRAIRPKPATSSAAAAARSRCRGCAYRPSPASHCGPNR